MGPAALPGHQPGCAGAPAGPGPRGLPARDLQGESGRLRADARRVIDLRPHVGSLAVKEAVTAFVGECEMRCPRDRERATLGAENHEFEPEAPPRVIGEM